MNDQQLNKMYYEAEPLVLDRIMGQSQVTSLLAVHLAAYWNDRQAGKNPIFGPVGLFGPPGVGKTLTARAVHAELGNCKFIETIGETLDVQDNLYHILMEIDENTTLFIDEAQGISTTAQHILLKVLAEGTLCVPKGKFTKKSYQIPLPNFVTILASTHEFTLQPALRSRLRIYGRLSYYSVEDLAKIVRQRVDSLGWPYETPEIFEVIAARAKKTPRLALRHLQMAYDVARSQNTQTITREHVQQGFALSQIDSAGLDELERLYLRVLLEADSLRLNVISSRLGLPNRTIQEVVEPYLIQEGLISKEGSERVITEKGKNHLANAVP